MRILLFGLIIACCLFSCKKENSPKVVAAQKELPFDILPTDSASWHLELIGSYYGDSSGYHFDPSYHFHVYTTVDGHDTFIKGNQYFVYRSLISGDRKGITLGLPFKSTEIYLRKDTSNNLVFEYEYGMTSEKVKFGFPILSAGEIAHSGSWSGIIQQPDTMILGGEKFQYCMVKLDGSYELMFYYGMGLGTQAGLVTADVPYGGDGSLTKSLTFRNKNDSVHFEYP
ncbi:MAG: hypothetical protein ABI378_14620 [Chitinophagaceae bacterium]